MSLRTRLEANPELLLVVSIASVQVGSSVAKDFFSHASPLSATWLRLLGGALVFALLTRPRLRGRRASEWGWVVAYGLVTAVMNLTFYFSIERIPIGTAVTLEFLGPLGVSVLSSRRLRDVVWVLLAGLGVALLGLSPTDLDPVGVLLALTAGACWGAYIVLARQVGRSWSGVDGVMVAAWVGAIVMTVPVVVLGDWPDASASVWAQGFALGLLSSAIPYGLEMLALRRIRPGTFGILMSLEPAAAAVFAFVLLGEALGPVELVAMACVVVASIGVVRASRTRKPTTHAPSCVSPSSPDEA